MSMKTIASKILAALNQRSLAICLVWSQQTIFSSGRHFYLSPLAVQKVTTPLVVDQNGGHIINTFHNCLYCKIIVVTDVVFKYFLEYSTTFFATYHPGAL